MIFVYNRIENIVQKGENSGNLRNPVSAIHFSTYEELEK